MSYNFVAVVPIILFAIPIPATRAQGIGILTSAVVSLLFLCTFIPDALGKNDPIKSR